MIIITIGHTYRPRIRSVFGPVGAAIQESARHKRPSKNFNGVKGPLEDIGPSPGTFDFTKGLRIVWKLTTRASEEEFE
jgi:hypothetical protein